MSNNFDWLFALRGEVKPKYKSILLAAGIGLVLLVWILLTLPGNEIVPRGILPSPIRVLTSFGELIRDNELIKNICGSYALNLGGYYLALLFALPIGFLIGLVPLFRGMFLDMVNAFRFVPLTAVTSLFIVWFGIGTSMKMFFLGFGIFIYLLPTLIQRIDEIEDVYLTTVHTLGASKWQTFKSVYWPAVLSKLSDDIRVLTAISWTYIIVVENIGANGGIGFLMHGPTARQGRVDKMFALLIIIMLIGVLQDKLFLAIDKYLFPHKYQLKQSGLANQENLVKVVVDFAIQALGFILLGLYLLLTIAEYFGIFGADIKPISYLFGDKAWVVHLTSLALFALLGYNITKRKKK